VQRLAKVGSWRYELPEDRLWWSDELYRIFGLEPGGAPLSPERLFSLIHPEDRATFEAQVASREPHRSDYRIVLPGGEVRHVHEEVRVERDEGGVPVRMFGTAQDVSERARIEGRLREQQSWLDAIVSVGSDWIWEVDAEARYTFVGERVREFLGYAPQELLGRSPFETMLPEDAERVRKAFAEIARERRSFSGLENANRHKDGHLVFLETSGVPLLDASGALRGYRGVDRNVTEKRVIENALRASESRYRAIVDSQAEFVVRYQPGGTLTFINDTLCRYLGLRREDLIGRSYYPFMHPEDRAAFVAKIEALDRSAPSMVAEARVVLPDGRVSWHQWAHHAYFDERGALIECQATGRDVTDRRAAEEALRKSERMLQTIIDAEPECVKLLDENANLLFMNRAGLEMLEADSLEQVKGRCVCPMVGSEHQPAFFELTRRVFHGGSGTLLFEMVGLKGRRLWLETHAVPLRDEQGRVVAVLGVTRDVTEQRRAEAALRSSETRFRSIIESSPVGIMVVDVETGRTRYANPVICRLLGYDEPELVSLAPTDLAVPEERPESVAEFQAHMEGRLSASERTLRRQDGSPVRVSIKSVPMELDGRPCSVGFFTDVTAQRQLEEERLRAQKLASIGTLAGGIAHDFNNLLQGVFGYLSMAKLSLDAREKALAMLEQAEQALHQSVSLTSQLLTFSKGGKPVRKVIDLRPVVENAVKFALSGSRVTFELAFDEDLRTVEADEGQIGQVVQNLVLNAEQAMPLGGRIEIAVRNAPPARAPEISPAPAAGLVEISVQDHGIGIPPAHLPRIFDPYFTTKEKGSGLGLATSYSIVKNHEGAITVRSELGQGSTFAVYLPACAAAREPAPAAPASAACARCRILVMDDERIVRTVMGELLEVLGHEVAFAEEGDAALAQYAAAREAGAPFDLVILDLTIRGGMGGEETLRRLREIDPAVRAVVSSGYSDDEVAATFRGHGFRAFLKKPYTLDELGRVLAEAMS
jgi:PAS domain S-box-containing protein